MKKNLYHLSVFIFLLLSTASITAIAGDSELIENRDEAKRLYNNFQEMYNTVSFDEKGGSISVEALEKLIQQAKANKSTEVVYYFGRTAPDKTGKNLLMFFNADYSIPELDGIDKFKTVKLCPTDCDINVEGYLK